VPYFLVTFTVPSELRALIRSNQKVCYGMLFSESAAAMQEVAAHDRHLGAQLGMLGVLHTWSRQLIYHPHVHYVVAGGGLSFDRLRFKRVRREDYLMPDSVLGRRFRNRLRLALAREHPDWLKVIDPKVWRVQWVVNVRAVGSGPSVLKYLAAYVYRTALGSQRIIAEKDGRVIFTYRESETGERRTMTLGAHEFIRRFLQHVLPKGFQRVRYFGWWAPAAKKRWARIETLLDWRAPEVEKVPPLPPPLCPVCGGEMVLIRRLARAPPPGTIQCGAPAEGAQPSQAA
jgi:hypothetical protein